MLSRIAGIYGDDAGRELRARVGEGAAPAGDGDLALAGVDRARMLRREDPLIVLEGRVDNLPALAEELGLGPDSEAGLVLCEGHRRWGDELAAQLRGDFVLCLWSASRRRGMIARDQVGVRGLFFSERGGRLLFASELANLLDLLPARPSPDRQAAFGWLATTSTGNERTLYDGVSRLPPGHRLRLEGGRWRVERYWQLRYEPPLGIGWDESVERSRSSFDRALRRRCRPGERVGVLLSGGIDSASIAAGLSHGIAGEASLSSYSGLFPGHSSVDESALIDELTERLRLRSVRAVVGGGSPVGAALRFTQRWATPPLGSNGFWDQELLAQAARDGSTVLLDGEGGDEVFGTRYFVISDLLRRARVLAAARTVRRWTGEHEPPRRAVLAVLRSWGLRGALPPRLHDLARRVKRSDIAPAWATAEGARRAVEADEQWAWQRLDGPRWWAYYANVFERLIDSIGLLDHARRRAEAVGLEARHPFLDVELIEECLRLPLDIVGERGLNRPMLREAMRGMVPDSIRLRSTKAVFNEIIESSLLREREVVERLLDGPQTEVHAYVRPDVVRRDILSFQPERHPRGRYAWLDELWRLVTLEVWLRSQGDPAFCERALRGWPLADGHQELVVVHGGRASAASDSSLFHP